MERKEIVVQFADAIEMAVRDWFWTREDAITEIQNLTEVEKKPCDVVHEFTRMVESEGEFLAKKDFEEMIRDREAYYGPAVDNSWMEPGVAYTMGDDGWESWEDPRANY